MDMENKNFLTREEFFYLHNLLSERYTHLKVKSSRLKMFDLGSYPCFLNKEMNLIDSIQKILFNFYCEDNGSKNL